MFYMHFLVSAIFISKSVFGPTESIAIYPFFVLSDGRVIPFVHGVLAQQPVYKPFCCLYFASFQLTCSQLRPCSFVITALSGSCATVLLLFFCVYVCSLQTFPCFFPEIYTLPRFMYASHCVPIKMFRNPVSCISLKRELTNSCALTSTHQVLARSPLPIFLFVG